MAFVPFSSIPIHARSFLSNLILLTISFVLILPFSFPILSPSSSKLFIISSFGIFTFPTNSIFHTKFDKDIIETVNMNKSIKKIFLFLYLLNIKGKPFLFFIFTLHLEFLAIFLTFLKLLMPILQYTRVDFVLFIFHKNIFFAIQVFINFSTKYPSISIFK